MRKVIVSMGAAIEMDTNQTDEQLIEQADEDPMVFFSLEDAELEITVKEVEPEEEEEEEVEEVEEEDDVEE
jgi:hypothetical protein